MLALRRLAARFVWMVPFAALVSTACEHNPGEPGALASITVVGESGTLPISTTRQFTAVGLDTEGNVVTITLPLVWSVAAGGGAISSAGLFTAGTAPGTFANTVTATVASISGKASVTVVAGPVASISVTPPAGAVNINAQQLFTAVGRDAANNVVPISPNWSVTAGGGTIENLPLPGVAGRFTAGSVAGTFTNTVRASVGSIFDAADVIVGATGLASITVSPNPQGVGIGLNVNFTAVGKDASGNVVPITPSWLVVAGGGAIDAASGVFTAGLVAGTFANTVRACSTAACVVGSSVAGFATVTVGPGTLFSIAVTPNPPGGVDVGIGASMLFSAVGLDANGNVVPILPLPTWTVQADVDEDGSFPAAPGTTNIYTAPPGPVGAPFDTVLATSGSITGKARVNIINSAGVASIAVTPNPASVIPGGTVQFTATAFDNNGVVVAFPLGDPDWTVTAVGGGVIDLNSGLFTAGTVPGTYTNTVKATSGAISGYATVTVNPLPPPGPSLGAAETHGLLAGSAFTCADTALPYSTIHADASVWPGTAFTGYPPCIITGATHAADASAQAAQGDLTTAFLALAAMPCGTTITADLGSTTLPEGVYCSASSVGVTGAVTLTGTANALFVIRAASTLTTAGSVVLAGGAQAKNVYWWVGSSATLGVNSAWQGNILALSSITLAGNVTLCGRTLARNGAVNLDGDNNTIKLPPAAPPTCTFP